MQHYYVIGIEIVYKLLVSTFKTSFEKPTETDHVLFSSTSW